MLMLKELSILKTAPSQAWEPCQGDVGAHGQKAVGKHEKEITQRAS